MIFASVRIVTDDIQGLVAFYERATALPARWLTPAFAMFPTTGGTVAIATPETLAFGGMPGVAHARDNRSVFIEFRVDDVDAEHARLADGIVDTFELAPTTLPWGNRSMLFRDPDGNLVNFFSPITDEARERQVV